MHLNDPNLQPLLLELIQNNNLKAFVETGTGYGVSLGWAYGLGLECWTCDVEQRQILPANHAYPNANVFLWESVPFLLTACHKVTVPALFWLDAHDSPEGGDPWPVYNELAVIREERDGLDVILCDDITDPRFDRERYRTLFAPTHDMFSENGIVVFIPR